LFSYFLLIEIAFPASILIQLSKSLKLTKANEKESEDEVK